jgi:hypothetical protein
MSSLLLMRKFRHHVERRPAALDPLDVVPPPHACFKFQNRTVPEMSFYNKNRFISLQS